MLAEIHLKWVKQCQKECTQNNVDKFYVGSFEKQIEKDKRI